MYNVVSWQFYGSGLILFDAFAIILRNDQPKFFTACPSIGLFF